MPKAALAAVVPLAESIGSRLDIIAAGAKLRAVSDANPSVWTEDVAAIGVWKTTVAVFLVL